MLVQWFHRKIVLSEVRMCDCISNIFSRRMACECVCAVCVFLRASLSFLTGDGCWLLAWCYARASQTACAECRMKCQTKCKISVCVRLCVSLLLLRIYILLWLLYSDSDYIAVVINSSSANISIIIIIVILLLLRFHDMFSVFCGSHSFREYVRRVDNVDISHANSCDNCAQKIEKSYLNFGRRGRHAMRIRTMEEVSVFLFLRKEQNETKKTLRNAEAEVLRISFLCALLESWKVFRSSVSLWVATTNRIRHTERSCAWQRLRPEMRDEWVAAKRKWNSVDENWKSSPRSWKFIL